MQNCWLGDNTVSLPDLKTERQDVQKMWQDWVGSLVSNYSSKFILYTFALVVILLAFLDADFWKSTVFVSTQ